MCGDGITAVRSADGEVVSWGSPWVAPWRVTEHFGPGERATAVAAGGRHCLAVTQPSGHVYMWSSEPAPQGQPMQPHKGRAGGGAGGAWPS